MRRSRPEVAEGRQGSRPAAQDRLRKMRSDLLFHRFSLTRLSDNIDQSRFASLDNRDGTLDPALMPAGHALYVHRLFVIGAVVVHDAQKRNAMMRRGPQHGRDKQKIAVVLNIDAEPAVFAVCQSGAHRGRRAVADPAARAADELIVLIKVPKL